MLTSDAIIKEVRAAMARTTYPATLQVQVLTYMLVQFTPVATGFRTRGGGQRPARDYDGTKRAVARLLGLPRENVRYHCKRVEELRDREPELEGVLRDLEHRLDEASQTA
jgi:hypothetical protein